MAEKHIVVGADGSKSAAAAIVWAAREAQLHNWGLIAVLAWDYLDQHHANPGAPFVPTYGEADARSALDSFVDAALVGDGVDVERRVVCDLAARALIESSRDASLLVVGSRGRGGFRSLLLGSVSQHCLHHAPCPVAVIHSNEEDPRPTDQPERIVVGLDGSDHGRRALQWAIEEARVRQGRLEVVHAWRLPYLGTLASVTIDVNAVEGGAQHILDSALDGSDTSGLTHPVERILVSGGAAAALLHTAEGASLIVVGSRGLGGFSGLLLGSVSYQVAHHARCPVIVVPAER
jgi:nucleotide-binding universal stress UspA family protein